MAGTQGSDPAERRLRALDAVAASLIADDDLDVTLALVARSVRELLDADTGGMGLPKGWPEPADTDAPFVIAAADGAGADELMGAEIPVESLTGLVTRRPGEVTGTELGDPRLSEAEADLAGKFGPVLIAPLRVGERVLGTLGVARAPGGPPFSEDDVHTLEEFARYAALLLAYADTVATRDRSVAELSRLYEASHRRERRHLAIAEVSAAVMARRPADETLRVLARGARHLCESELATIIVSDCWPHADAGGPLKIRAADGDGAEDVLGTSFGRLSSLSGAAHATRAPQVSNDISRDPRLGALEQARARKDGWGPLLVVPLLLDGARPPYAAVCCIRRIGEPVFSASDVDAMLAFVHDAGLRIGYGLALDRAEDAATENAALLAASRRHEALLSASSDITRALLSGSSWTETLHDLTVSARELLGADIGAFALAQGWPTPVPGGDLVVVASDGVDRPDGSTGPSLSRSSSLMGQVFDSGEPMLLTDTGRSPDGGSGVRDSVQFGSAVLVPVRVAGETAGVLAVVNEEGGKAFTPSDLDNLGEFADRIALALEYDRGQRGVRALRIAEDRERIAQELHDTAIQGLYAAGIILQSALRPGTEPPSPEKLTLVGEGIARGIDDIRHSIFTLRPRRRHPDGLRTDLHLLCAESANVLGFAPLTQIDPAVSQLPDDLASSLLDVLQEALSNAARHAGASSVEVAITCDGNLRLRVADDGLGPPESGPAPEGEHRAARGLKTMRAGAEAWGGSCTLERREPRGTLLEWRVPLP